MKGAPPRRAAGPTGPARWLRGLAVAATAAAFLTVSGAFGTGNAPLAVRAAYWCVLIALGYVWGSAVARLFFAGGRLRTGFPWLDVLLASLLMSVPLTGVVWVASNYAFGGSPDLAELPYYFGPVFAISVVLTAINMLIEMRHDGATAEEAAAPPPRFLERLPLKLRGAEVWAVEAEDHYLRLHTSRGQDLILMRLADAVAELEGIEGAQVHRSWWVARDAIVGARRGDGRATLTLKDGAEVPVSRTYAGALRDKGWI
ncbi:LytTR family DNA-binding domain-containing protein [Phenylobacterium sp.]|uniref:LytTR family DNA-binding domain-containing protein n=1 Tax=Phenylobacterium sp. TaxID=1871053 RepID=UPI00301C6D25